VLTVYRQITLMCIADMLPMCIFNPKDRYVMLSTTCWQQLHHLFLDVV